VFTPTLTGLGERAHLTGPTVSLTTHVLDVVNTIRYEDLHDIVLVGFSYGGMVVTGALRHVRDRVRELMYLDAFVPGDGESVVSLLPERAVPDTFPAPWQIPPVPRPFENPESAAFAEPRRTPQPAATFTEPVRLDAPLEDGPFGLTYVRATVERNAAFEAAAARAKASPAWRYHELDTGHLVPENRPQELAELLLALG
jgi:pimeloyl-ACP methyl ester carboxylesterase